MPVRRIVQRYDAGEVSLTAHALEIEAADNADPARQRRFSMLAYDGGPLRLPNYQYPLYVDLTGLDLSNQVRPVLLDHQRDSEHIVGQTEHIAATETELTAEGPVIGKSPAVLRAIQANDDGFRWKASIGASPIVKPTLVPAGSTYTVNGRVISGPAYVSTKTRLGEISFVVIGASEMSAAQIAASAAGDFQIMTFEQFVTQCGFDPATLSDVQRQFLQSAFDALPPAAGEQANATGGTGAPGTGTNSPVAPKPGGQVNATGTLEITASDQQVIQRNNAIHAICFGARGNFPEIEAAAIAGDWDLKATTLKVLQTSRPHAPNVITRNPTRDPLVIEASLAFDAGIDPNKALERGWYDERTIEAAESPAWRNMSICRLGHEIVASAGGHLRPGKLNADGVRHIFECDRRLANSPSSWDIQAAGSGGVSTISLAGSLGNLMGRLLLNSFLEVESVVAQISAKSSPTDYKEFKSFMINMSGDLEEVGPNGQLPDVTLSEEEWANQVKLKGAYLSVSEVTFVNDDLGVFAAVPKMFGRKAAIGREKAGMTVMLSNPTTGGVQFYSATNGNYLSGADTALSIDALTAASALADEQTDGSDDEDPIILPMTRILVPAALKVPAGKLYTDDKIVVAGSTDTMQTSGNPHVGSFFPLMSPFLGTKFGLPNSSNTAYYLLPDKGDIAPLNAAYLNGQEQPTVEKGEVDFRTLGVAWRVTYRLGFAKGNKRAVIKLLGAAP